MARIQIADLQPEILMELTDEEQLLIQGGWFWFFAQVAAQIAALGYKKGWW